MKKLKERWGVTSNMQLTLIFIVFAVNGTIAGKLMKPVLAFLGITHEHLPWYLYWPLACILILPVYFLMIRIIGRIFGQGKFFDAFVKKSVSRMGFGFLYRK